MGIFRICALMSCLSPVVVCAEAQVLAVTAHSPSVYDAPSDSAKALFRAKRGQKFKVEGAPKNGFYRLKTKAGKVVWISEHDVKVGSPEGVHPPNTPVKLTHKESPVESSAEEAKETPFDRWSIDLGASSNFSNGGSAYELYVGVNYSILRWLVWRNSPFFRTQSNSPSVFGLDTSLQGRHGVSVGDAFQLHGLLGAGYRIANQGASAPFAELGIGVRKNRFEVNVGIKEVFHSLVNSKYDNEMLFSLNISGGASF